MKVSIIVPCYNEANNIERLVETFIKLKNEYKTDIELILVNNGSQDNTRDKILFFMGKYNCVRLVNVEVNKGYGYGILSGLKYAEGEYLGWIHADLQADPKVIFEMIESASREKKDFLYKGLRSNRPLTDVTCTVFMAMFESVYLRTMLWDINAQPTLMSRHFFSLLKDFPYDFSFDLFVYYMAKKCNVRIKRFKSIQYKRYSGVSSWNSGLVSRVKLIKKVLRYSVQLKKIVVNKI